MNLKYANTAFIANFKFQPYTRRAIIISLMDNIADAAGIDELERVVACAGSTRYFVRNNVCKRYFELLDGDQIKLLNFVFVDNEL